MRLILLCVWLTLITIWPNKRIWLETCNQFYGILPLYENLQTQWDNCKLNLKSSLFEYPLFNGWTDFLRTNNQQNLVPSKSCLNSQCLTIVRSFPVKQKYYNHNDDKEFFFVETHYYSHVLRSHLLTNLFHIK